MRRGTGRSYQRWLTRHGRIASERPIWRSRGHSLKPSIGTGMCTKPTRRRNSPRLGAVAAVAHEVGGGRIERRPDLVAAEAGQDDAARQQIGRRLHAFVGDAHAEVEFVDLVRVGGADVFGRVGGIRHLRPLAAVKESGAEPQGLGDRSAVVGVAPARAVDAKRQRVLVDLRSKGRAGHRIVAARHVDGRAAAAIGLGGLPDDREQVVAVFLEIPEIDLGVLLPLLQPVLRAVADDGVEEAIESPLPAGIDASFVVGEAALQRKERPADPVDREVERAGAGEQERQGVGGEKLAGPLDRIDGVGRVARCNQGQGPAVPYGSGAEIDAAQRQRPRRVGERPAPFVEPVVAEDDSPAGDARELAVLQPDDPSLAGSLVDRLHAAHPASSPSNQPAGPPEGGGNGPAG